MSTVEENSPYKTHKKCCIRLVLTRTTQHKLLAIFLLVEVSFGHNGVTISAQIANKKALFHSPRIAALGKRTRIFFAPYGGIDYSSETIVARRMTA